MYDSIFIKRNPCCPSFIPHVKLTLTNKCSTDRHASCQRDVHSSEHTIMYCGILASVDESGTVHGLLFVAASDRYQATDVSRLLELCREPGSTTWICNIYHTALYADRLLWLSGFDSMCIREVGRPISHHIGHYPKSRMGGVGGSHQPTDKLIQA